MMSEDAVVGLAAVTVLGVLQQAYFSLQVIYARRKYSVSPPATSGPPAFDRIFRAQANCSEYFPIFLSVLWTSGVFFSQGERTSNISPESSVESSSALLLFQVCLQSSVCSTCTDASGTFVDILSRHSNGRRLYSLLKSGQRKVLH
uniref:Leukotriene C4 synthase n=1 Tax=Gasterosteus aculeatus aculeatus TaxID=481459 RepID=A0AAQ4RZ50_GASAC